MKILRVIIIILITSVTSLFAPPGDSVSTNSQNEYIFKLNSNKTVDNLIFDFIINELKDNYKKIEFSNENIGSYRKNIFKKISYRTIILNINNNFKLHIHESYYKISSNLFNIKISFLITYFPRNYNKNFDSVEELKNIESLFEKKCVESKVKIMEK